jgi:DNA-binding GntR family transcriptional regulator
MDDPRQFARARELIRRRIADGDYAPGTRIHVGGLADELGVSRPTVSRAMGEVAGEGLVRYWPGLGWYVTRPG